MNRAFATTILPAVVLAAGAALTPALAGAQTMGSENFEASDDAPGQSDAAPPTSAPEGQGGTAVHPGDDAPRRNTGGTRELPAGEATATVQVSHATDDGVDLAGMPVLLEAVRPPGPLQPDNREQIVSTWEATTDADGVARFEDLPDDLAGRRLAFRATTDFNGFSFESDLVDPGPANSLDLRVYDPALEFPGVRVAQKRVLVSPWEDYMIVDQLWTLQLEGDRAFDLATSAQFDKGIPLELPREVEGISVSGPGQHQVVENVVYWQGALQPDRPITLQIRFSKSVDSPEFTYEQQVDYPVDDLSILASVDTDFDKVPRLEDLVLRAPEFDVGDDPTAAGLPPHTSRDFLVASRDDGLESGQSYTFRLEGLPYGKPVGSWIALIGGVLGAVFVALYGRREYLEIRKSETNEEAVEALKNRRDELLDELADVRRRLDETDDDDEIFDLEQEEMLIRQRLALIMRKLEDLSSEDSPAADAA